MAQAGIDFRKVLEEKKKLVWPEIKKYLDSLTCFPQFCRPPAKYRSLVSLHQKIVSDYPQRKGKYLRPALVLLTAEAMGLLKERAIRTAAAMQVSQDWILNHDDIEDNSLQRRGQPTLHQIYGLELAINAGDALHVLMWKMLTDNRELVGQALAQAILEEFYQILKRTTLGQAIEIKWAKGGKTDLTLQDILLILESKTVYYTIAGPMRLGAILAEATQRQLKAIWEFAKPLGYAFQIKDDLLDLTSDFAGLKKQQGNDIYEGKRTIMLMHLFRNVKGKDKIKLHSIMSKSRERKSASEVVWVIGLMRKYGSLAYGQKLAEKYARQAQDLFDKELGFLKQQPARDQLKAGIDFILTRDH